MILKHEHYYFHGDLQEEDANRGIPLEIIYT